MSDEVDERARRWAETLYLALYGQAPDVCESITVPVDPSGALRLGIWVPGAPLPAVVAVDPCDVPDEDATGDWTRDPLVAEAVALAKYGDSVRSALDGRFVTASAAEPSDRARAWRASRGGVGLTAWFDDAWIEHAGHAPMLQGVEGHIGVPLPAESWGTSGLWSMGATTTTPAVFVPTDGARWHAQLLLTASEARLRIERPGGARPRPRAWFAARCVSVVDGEMVMEVEQDGGVTLRGPETVSAWRAAWVTDGDRFGVRVTGPPDPEDGDATTVLDRAAVLSMIGRERGA